jgi:hypothetical protein
LFCFVLQYARGLLAETPRVRQAEFLARWKQAVPSSMAVTLEMLQGEVRSCVSLEVEGPPRGVIRGQGNSGSEERPLRSKLESRNVKLIGWCQSVRPRLSDPGYKRTVARV